MTGFATGIALAGVILLLVLARNVHSAKDKQGEGFARLDSASVAMVGNGHPEGLRVATFNIQTGKSLQGKRDIGRSAALLKGVDLAAVQEVYGAGWFNKLGIGDSQSNVLATTGRFAHLFAATRYRWFREQRGNTTLSKLSIGAWQIKMLPDQSRKSPRNMTIAQFEWQGEPAIFINTHLHTGRGREDQLQTVLAEFLRHPRVILAGDFNTTSNDPQMQAVLNEESVTDAIAEAGLLAAGEQRIDWILTRGFEVLAGEEQGKGVSDHPYYEVILR